MQIANELTFDEWRDLASSIGHAASSIGFIVGDWLVYGQNLFGSEGYVGRRVDSKSYQLAIDATGLDLSTLQSYAYVSRNVPFCLRSEKLSWEHHRLVAKLTPEEQQEWIEACITEANAGRRMTTRRLRKSINLGRIANEDDMEPNPADKGIENHLPFVNRLSVWWKRMQSSRFLSTSTREQRAALKRDLEPIVQIYNQL